MSKLTEAALKAQLKSGSLSRVYYIFGEEDFLVKTYLDRIAAAAVPEDARDMNFVKYTDAPPADELSDYLENMPFFSDYRCAVIYDLDADELDNAAHKDYLSIIENIPDTSVLIIAQLHVTVDTKKPKAKTKKLLEAVERCGSLCEFRFLPASKTADMAVKKAGRAGCTLSHENASYISELCGRSLTMIGQEITKLCDYKQSGEITRADIERLTPRLIDTSVYTLSDAIFAGNTARAYEILDDLFAMRTEPMVILASISSYFTDLYRARIALDAKKSPAQAAADFGYPRNRTFLLDRAFTAARRLPESYLARCLEVLYNANKTLNSSNADKRVVIERVAAELAGAI